VKISFVLDRETAACLKLAGMQEVYVVDSPQEAEERLEKLQGDSDVLAILIVDRMFKQIPAAIERIERQKYPAVLAIPSIRGPVPIEPDPLAELVRRKVGIEVRW
jgi:vacuolar-type H+-ATPase subunit F/Vma7